MAGRKRIFYPADIECPICKIQLRQKHPYQKFCSNACKFISARKPSKNQPPATRWSKRRTPEERRESLVARSIRWQKDNKVKVYVARMARKYKDFLAVLYECPCASTSKHNHHPDYSRPFEVIVLCPKCHSAWHAKLNDMDYQKKLTEGTA